LVDFGDDLVGVALRGSPAIFVAAFVRAAERSRPRSEQCAWKCASVPFTSESLAS
jgi:hypothetical protein